MNLDEAMAALSERFVFVEFDLAQPKYNLAPTGDPYVTIVGGGIKPEGERWLCIYFDRDALVRAWFDSVIAYGGNRQVLFWRERPSIVQINGDGIEIKHIDITKAIAKRRPAMVDLPAYQIWSRLVITDAQASFNEACTA